MCDNFSRASYACIRRYEAKKLRIKKLYKSLYSEELSNGYGQAWEVTLQSDCSDIYAFMSLLDDMLQCLRRTYKAIGFGVIENSTAGDYALHAHFVLRFPRPFTQMPHSSHSERLRASLLKDWKVRCQRHGIGGYDRSSKTLMRQIRSEADYLSYLLKDEKHGVPTKVNGLILRKVGTGSFA